MKLGYVIFYVPDVKATIEFYEKAFGLERGMLHDEYGELDTGATTLSFFAEKMVATNGVTVRPSRSSDEQAPAVEIALMTDDPAGAFAHAVANGAIAVQEATRKPWGQTVAFVRDCNGFLVELCTPVTS